MASLERSEHRLLVMRLRKPHPASLEEVKITRSGDEAIVEFVEPGIAVTHLQLGPLLRSMTDREILDCFNDSLGDHAEVIEQGENVVVEVPAGGRQIEYFEPGRQWAPRASLLRCVIDDGGPRGEAVVHIDDIELSLADFGRLLCTFAGWGMRIAFVPEERLHDEPRVEIGEPDDRREAAERRTGPARPR